MCRELPLGFLSQYESNLKHRRHLLQSSTLHPPPQTQDKKKRGGAPTKGPNTLLFLLRWKIAQISSTCKKLGGKPLPVGYTYIYILLQNLLLQTGSFWQAEETWQCILTNLHERQITMVGEKIIKEKEKGKRKIGKDSVPLNVVKSAQVTTTWVASFTWRRGRRRRRGVLVGSLPHVTYHISSSWRLCKLLWHQWLWLLPRPAYPTKLLARALWTSPSWGGATGPVSASAIFLGCVTTGAISSCPIGALTIGVLACLCSKGRIWTSIATAVSITGSIGFTTIPIACRVSPATIFDPSKPPVTLILIHQIGIVGWRSGPVSRTAAPSSAASSVVHQLHQFWIDSLISLF